MKVIVHSSKQRQTDQYGSANTVLITLDKESHNFLEIKEVENETVILFSKDGEQPEAVFSFIREPDGNL